MGKMKNILMIIIILLGMGICFAAEGTKADSGSLQVSAVDSSNRSAVQTPVETPVSEKELLEMAERQFDRSVSVMNLAVTIIGVFSALIVIIIALGGFIGYREHLKVKEIRAEATKYAEETKKCRDEADKVLKEIIAIRQRAEQEKDAISSKIPTAPIDQEVTEEVKAQLEELKRALETLKILGIPLKAEDFRKRARAYYYEGKYELSLQDLNALTNIEPNDAEAWNSKGVVLTALDRKKEALECHEQALKLKPDLAEAWYNKGVVLDDLGRKEEALECYEQALKYKPNDAKAWYNKGVVLDDLGRKEEALESFDQALKLKPDLAGAWYNKACLYSKMGDKKAALENLKRAIELDGSVKDKAKKDAYFDSIRDDEEFIKLVGKAE